MSESGAGTGPACSPSDPAVIILAHDKPAHLARLIAALSPLRVYLHIDAQVPDALHEQMTAGLPERVELLRRVSTSWGGFGLVQAELAGYARALQETTASHVILLSGSDYPLAGVDVIRATLAAYPEQSFTSFVRLPNPEWAPYYGYDRFYFRQRAWRKHRLFNPIPRRLPQGLTPAGGWQWKILARSHAIRVLDVLRARPDIADFFRSAWIPDEVLIPSVLTSSAFSPDWRAEAVPGEFVYHFDWGRIAGKKPPKSPRWLGEEDLEILTARRCESSPPALFARKFGEGSERVLDRIDEELRGLPVEVPR